jgi:hypothetical protein
MNKKPIDPVTGKEYPGNNAIEICGKRMLGGA